MTRVCVRRWSIGRQIALTSQPAFFAIKRAITPISVGLKRTITSMPLGRDTTAERTQTTLAVFAFNAKRFHRRLALRLRSAELITGHLAIVEERLVDLPPCQSTELSTWSVGDVDIRAPLVYEAQLRDVDTDELIHRSMNWPEPCVRCSAVALTASDSAASTGRPKSRRHFRYRWTRTSSV